MTETGTAPKRPKVDPAVVARRQVESGLSEAESYCTHIKDVAVAMGHAVPGLAMAFGLREHPGNGDVTAYLTPERVTRLAQDLRRAAILVERVYQEYGSLFERYEPGYRQLGATRYRAPSLTP